jgi:hypothetical protein
VLGVVLRGLLAINCHYAHGSESPDATGEELEPPAAASRSRSARDPSDGHSEPGDFEGRRSKITSSRPQALHRAEPRRRARADSDVPRRHKRQAVQKEIYTSSEEDSELDETEEHTKLSASDQATVNPNAGLQPRTSELPSGLLKSGKSFSLQVTLVRQTMPARTTVNLAPTLSHLDARPSGPPIRHRGLRMLQDQAKAEPFRSLKLPDSINWL